MERFTCGYCGAHELQTLFATQTRAGENFQLALCPNCQTQTLVPQPTDAQLAHAYDDSYYGEKEEKFGGWVERVLDGFRNGRARKIARLLPSGGTVLDIGCGNGRFLQSLIQRGFIGHGIELPGGSADRAARVPGLNLKVGSLAPDDFAPNSLNAVTLWHVYEHLREPKRTLEIISQILKPGGFLVLSLPNIKSWQAQWFKGDWFHLDPPRHLFFQGPDCLQAHVTALGFDCKEVNFFSLEQNPFGFQQSLINRYASERDFLYELLKGNQSALAQPAIRRWFHRLLGLLTTAPAIALSILEALAGRGGTMELVFQKRPADSK